MPRKAFITAGLAVAMAGAGIGIATAAEAAVPTVNCPQVTVNVTVPAQAQAEVDNNLRLLDQQINEANNRIASTAGQGGANFIQNAILGPLKDKRFAAINRIETAISRNAARPNLNAEGLATCTLNQNGGAPAVTTPPAAQPGNNLGILTDTCETSRLEAHTGFQLGNRCVSTEFGEVGTAANNPTLLITRAPQQVRRNQSFTLQISTRNLIRDRFLAAGQGGYYVESSVLQGGLVRGHFHTACRILDSTSQAPAPEPVPGFFVATEDSRGGATPDTIAIQVPGLAQAGTFQCSAWAGDGSHRIPMMERANQTPALDSVRIRVR
ncbi:hypothetical protein GCM10010112_32160 [Actinoplanes lobatus]|uniref:Uncharacterized protein n=1 Tax=Actinoplanes lobatus TaxID=113568 RepID=A0A7W7HE95_9ACTN|nr:hypothetical protein [Actinoplanes lobatus]MBB4748930.1 hypothetical protein [Actinoplanes lobatus]GGN68123.1 hypothetical protein GCM10010112_32160 [Actinoplanes lobatus]GIE37163.1 hypothetical protein Alo02nite_00610 [Actinoplanes lobatus]